ncbi:hypothetical protein EPI10_016766 [Gossypium australe]|uniref:Uncharacterized protein n=1 Tax=Gossypium australe TaxID=47621 RepID=A0A5B6VPX3_9ROSI|nr:hypothetical protein EPI10_016766 [Gossypium australe]
MHFKGREARFPMLKSKKEEVERENRTEPIAPQLFQGKRKKSKDSRFPHTHIGCEKENELQVLRRTPPFAKMCFHIVSFSAQAEVRARHLAMNSVTVEIDSSERWACHVKAGPSNDCTKSLRHSATFCATGPHLGRECALTHSIKIDK